METPALLGPSLALSGILFSIGVLGVLLRRNAIILFMCIELMLNAVNLAFIAFARLHGSEGHVIVFFVMTVAAAEAAQAATLPATSGNIVLDVAGPLFNAYLIPFEVTSVLLLAAIVGAVVLAKRRI